MHVLDADQFTPESILEVFQNADSLRDMLAEPETRLELAHRHNDKQICSLFYEPSTRTRTSFEAAALKLGMGVVSTENAAEFSSAAKGETIEDTTRVLNQYGFAAIVIRHPETGAVARAAAVSDVPILNAGDGKGEHPTQCLLDAYTIYRQFGRLDNLRVVMGGDLRNGRTVRSLAKVLAKYPGNELVFVSIPALQMADDIKEILTQSGTKFSEADDLETAFQGTDVVYWTRLQKERLDPDEPFDSSAFIISTESLGYLPEKAIIMHPLPRVDEISPEVDTDPRAKYFEQAGNGLYVRMALLDQVVGGKR
ncbi:MAG TPA: aspartate carbamoyltransferase [Candidatus Saccharimonadia bacterium]|nr:aspartate carbamoyltransferase [Candidatus Saccharimonadia bacterium]